MRRTIENRGKGEVVKKKFKAVIVDSGPGIQWQVWNVRLEVAGHESPQYMYAEFRGQNCGQYAKDHARMLNALPEEEKP